MMYTRELQTPPVLKIGSTGEDVRRVQEWLNLHDQGVEIDGDFGPATERAINTLFTRANGQVDSATWDMLTGELHAALKTTTNEDMPFGIAVRSLAIAHLEQRPLEVGGDNKGPWVRTYCRGFEVAWCQGFVNTIWDQAATALAVTSPINLMPDGQWCLFVPRMVDEARKVGLLQFPESDKPVPIGSMFFLRGGTYGYSHTGIVVADHGETFESIEGNTNDNGSANGYKVCRRFRKKSSCDFGRSEPLASSRAPTDDTVAVPKAKPRRAKGKK